MIGGISLVGIKDGEGLGWMQHFRERQFIKKLVWVDASRRSYIARIKNYDYDKYFSISESGKSGGTCD